MTMHIARYVLLVALCMSAFVAAQQESTFRDIAPPPEPAGKGIIRGVVTAADTGRAIRNASIFIQGADPTSGVGTRSVSTDEQGRYEIGGLQGGQYRVSATKPGYVSLSSSRTRAEGGSRVVTLSESTPLEKIDFALSPGSVIVVRITDQFGDPVRGVTVRPMLHRFLEGRRQLSGVAVGAGGSTTDDRGETRVYGLGPGDYYLVAMPDFQTAWRGEIETLFPGTLDLANAQTVRVGVGQAAFATFPILRAPLSKLSGRIIGSDGAPLVTTDVSLQKLSLTGGGSSQRINIEPDGSFRQENLAPGDWMIVVRQPEYGSVRVRLLGDDIQGLILTTRKAAAVRGRVTFEGGPTPTSPLLLEVMFDGPRTLTSGAGFVQRGSIYVTPDTQWTFDVQVAGIGVIRPRACCVPDDNGVDRASPWILKAVLLDGKDVTDTLLDFGTAYAGKPVEVVLTQQKGQLSGVVQDDRGLPASDYRVVLFPEDEQQWTPFSRFIFLGRPDQQGRFTIANLPASRYLAAAVESLDPGEERNPETLSRLRGVATTVDLSDGQTRSMTLRLTR
jgi:hypothetical protein